ncbi:MAG TPA: carbonic anhydrase [Candidatus Solibacter sp.]
MDDLLAGYRRFREKGWLERRAVFESLARHGQAPRAMVVACVDSRVDPAMIFDAAPGEILTVRNVANLVPPYAPDAAYHGTSAALEFGVRVLQVRHLMVMGHGLCGGVQALLQGTTRPGHEFVAPWMSIAEAARVRVMSSVAPEDRQRACEHEAIKVSLANLITFPWIADRVQAGTLALHGTWFDIHTGVLMVLQADETFAPA